MGYEQAQQRSRSANKGSEGYLRLDRNGTAVHIVVNIDVGPWYREEHWEDGAPRPERARMGSKLYPVVVEVPVWEYNTAAGKWVAKILDVKESACAELFATIDPGKRGAVLKVAKAYRPHPTNRAWSLLTITAAATGHMVAPGELSDRDWPTPKGITLAEVDQPPPQSAPHGRYEAAIPPPPFAQGASVAPPPFAQGAPVAPPAFPFGGGNGGGDVPF